MGHHAAEMRAQPFFVINDEAYDRMPGKLRRGSPYEWSYITTCLHGSPRQCTCPKFKNVLSPSGTIVRVIDGVTKPVLRGSDLLRALGRPLCPRAHTS